MNTIFSFRTDSKTQERLTALSKANLRSRGNFIRWLINHTYECSALSPSEQQTLYRFVAENGRNYCHMCGRCRAKCPAGLPIPDILRLLAYHEGYHKTRRAQRAYASLKNSEKAPACRDCGQCEKACPYRVSVRSQIRRAHALLG